VQNLGRLDEANEEDVKGVHFSMGCIENLTEVRPDVAVLVCENTHILAYLLSRVSAKVFDQNKLYCSEILSILLQADPINQKRVGAVPGTDGIDCLLQVPHAAPRRPSPPRRL